MDETIINASTWKIALSRQPMSTYKFPDKLLRHIEATNYLHQLQYITKISSGYL